MGLFALLLGWPLLPLKGVVNLAGVIQDQAEQELHDPAAVRRQLEAIAAAQEAGEISEEEAAEQQRAATARLIGQRPPAADASSEGEM